ncbi:hypothetical protein PENTCL1PPCAC_11033, partial [Pristionchus entomophagus]
MYIHRYRTMLTPSEQYGNRWRFVNILLITAILQWESICLFIMKPNDKLRRKIHAAFEKQYDIDFMQLHFLAVDLDEPIDAWLLIIALSVFFAVSILVILIIRCGFRMRRLISDSISSERVKQIQRRVLRLLVFQV